MMPFVRTLPPLLLMATAATAFGGVVIVPSDGELTLPIHPGTGSLVQLPAPVKVVSPSQHFEVASIGADLDPSTGGKVDVRLFQVRSLKDAASESVTFILASGRSVRAKFATSGNADSFYDLVLPSVPKQLQHPSFLQAEVALMAAMIRDQPAGFARQVKDSSVKLAGLGDASAKLTRVFAGRDLRGYTFEIRNTSSGPLALDVRRLGLGSTDQGSELPILVHAAADEIPPCSFLSSKGCTVNVFIVARDSAAAADGLTMRSGTPGTGDRPPFERSSSANPGHGGAP